MGSLGKGRFAVAKFRGAASPFGKLFVKARKGGYGRLHMKIHPLTSKTDDLAALIARMADHDFVAVDTEFMRENTYWPDLCLLQIATPDEAAAIDPKADGLDLTPLLDLLVRNDEVLKVFHAGGQDLEIIHNMTGRMPAPLFDTQIAAMALGYGEQIGYSNLIESILGHNLDKGARTLRWVGYGMAVTMDFSPHRLTVYLDKANRVERASCG